jgi:hypothetical protein
MEGVAHDEYSNGSAARTRAHCEVTRLSRKCLPLPSNPLNVAGQRHKDGLENVTQRNGVHTHCRLTITSDGVPAISTCPASAGNSHTTRYPSTAATRHIEGLVLRNPPERFPQLTANDLLRTDAKPSLSGRHRRATILPSRMSDRAASSYDVGHTKTRIWI